MMGEPEGVGFERDQFALGHFAQLPFLICYKKELHLCEFVGQQFYPLCC